MKNALALLVVSLGSAPLVSVLVTGCGGASTEPPVPAPVASPAGTSHAVDAPEARPTRGSEAAREEVRLRLVRRAPVETYRRRVEVESHLAGLDLAVSFEGPLEVRPGHAGREVQGFDDVLLEVSGHRIRQEFDGLSLEMSGAPRSLPPELLGFRAVALEAVLSDRGAVVGGVSLAGTTRRNHETFRVLGDGIRIGHPVFPDRPLAVGEHWDAEPYVVDTRPTGPVVMHIHPTYSVERVEEADGERWVVLGVDARVDLEPFAVAGMRLEGEGPVTGTHRIALGDGLRGTIDLSGELTVRPPGAGQGGIPLRLGVRQAIVRQAIVRSGADVP